MYVDCCTVSLVHIPNGVSSNSVPTLIHESPKEPSGWGYWAFLLLLDMANLIRAAILNRETMEGEEVRRRMGGRKRVGGSRERREREMRERYWIMDVQKIGGT